VKEILVTLFELSYIDHDILQSTVHIIYPFIAPETQAINSRYRTNRLQRSIKF